MGNMQKVTAQMIIEDCQKGYAAETVDPKFIQEDVSKWNAVPNQGITSGDAATVFHEGYETLRDMVRRKAGLMPARTFEGNKFAVSIKKSVVSTILDWLGEYFGLVVTRGYGWFKHPLYPFMLAKPDATIQVMATDANGSVITTTDGEIVYQNYVVNVVMVNSDAIKGENGWLRWDEEDRTYKQQVPLAAELRARHDAAVFNAGGAFVIGVPIGSSSPESWLINRIERDAEKEACIVNEEWLVWNMVEEKDPPPYYLPMGADIIGKAFMKERNLKKRSASEDIQIIPLTEDIENAVKQIRTLNEDKKRLKKELELVEQQIVEASIPIAEQMKNTDAVIEGIDMQASYTVRTTTGINKENLKKLEVLFPYLYQRLIAEGYISTNTSVTKTLVLKPWSAKNAAKKINQKK